MRRQPGPARRSEPARADRRVAVTFDDLPTISVARGDLEAQQATTRGIVAACAAHRIPAVGFVNEAKVLRNGEPRAEQVALLKTWVDAGLELGNHTLSHLDLHQVSVEEYERDILLGAEVTRELLERSGRTLTYFRHPYLNTGRDLETKLEVATFLAAHGYRIAPVTIYLEDYWFAAAYDWGLFLGSAARAERVVRAYLPYVEATVWYYETLSEALFDREIPQVMLLHANALNARVLPQIMALLARRGYSTVTLDEALRDPAYGSADTYVGAVGVSWLQRWALTRGLPDSSLDGEPETPAFVRRQTRTPARVEWRRRLARWRNTLARRVKRRLAEPLAKALGGRTVPRATSRARSG